RCEHGTIHLTWDLMTIYLDDETFTALGQALDKGAALIKPGKVAHQHCYVFHREEGYYQVWVRNVALNLSPADFLIFAELAQVALAELAGPPAAAKATPALRRTVKASPTHRFSWN